MIRELTEAGDVVSASGDDFMTVWAAQGMGPGVRVFASGEAIAVVSPGLSRRDRMLVTGPLDDAVPLVRHALAESGPSFRPLGEESLVRGLAERVGGLRLAGVFDWMDTGGPPPVDPGKASWLAEEESPEVAALLADANPGSYAAPGVPGVRRWAGVRTDAGALASVGADAWTAPGAGFIAGVATAVRERGRGHAESVCRFLLGTLLAEHGRVALIVDSWNHTAIGVYERLGMRRRSVAAAHTT
ncbi:GNAT family N-acetyltransferase [Sphaerisporangium viridialbum]|uniref:GNAT family N-acetyltransferase n=1 Tax=Sphaerisporangium viridialbum TaxID=46189 RepID=UPI003C782A02